jgi:anhydro-N-acetylmuramic acid kinase
MAKVVGIMSGTSLDGLDLAFCEFDALNPSDFKITAAETTAYPEVWQKNLRACETCRAVQLAEFHVSYANYVAQQVKTFLSKNALPLPDLLAFHGHTIFHQPNSGFTFQLGSGAALAATSGLKTVSDFRTANVVSGGQGAPLVPIGDLHLFANHSACLNIGGFANISLKTQTGGLTAFDICPANMALNELAKARNLDFDAGGYIASGGKINQELLSQLNELDFYSQKPPKSLGREWYLEFVKPLVSKSEISIEDKLATFCEHIALQVAVSANGAVNMLITGGGAKNNFLIQRIAHHFKGEINVPDETIVDFKEALIFAYLGLLRVQEKSNCLAEYTGSSRNHCAGSLHLA